MYLLHTNGFVSCLDIVDGVEFRILCYSIVFGIVEYFRIPMLIVLSSYKLLWKSCFIHAANTVIIFICLLIVHRWLLTCVFIVCLTISSIDLIYVLAKWYVYFLFVFFLYYTPMFLFFYGYYSRWKGYHYCYCFNYS